MGAALQAAFMVMTPIGGKLLLFQAAVPSLGALPTLLLSQQADQHTLWALDKRPGCGVQCFTTDSCSAGLAAAGAGPLCWPAAAAAGVGCWGLSFMR